MPVSSHLDCSEFFSWFPEFNDPARFDTNVVKSAGRQARMWIDRDECVYLKGEERAYAFYCMVAHLLLMREKEQGATDPSKRMGQTTSQGSVGGAGLIQSASVGGVSLSMQVPQYFKGAWDWWLGQTIYGQKLLAFLESRVSIAIYAKGDDLRECVRD